MKLKVADRLVLLGLLPQTGNLLTMRIVSDLRRTLGFSEKETAEFGLEVDPASDQIRWQSAADRPKEIEIGPVAQRLLADRLLQLDKEEKLLEQHLPWYERFVQEKEPTPIKAVK